jgi:hypothetical protein
MVLQLNWWFGNADETFAPASKRPIIPQIEEFAANNCIVLPDRWKVMLAKKIKIQLAKSSAKINDTTVSQWKTLFDKFVDNIHE